jgi:hypothetical protein
VNNAVNRNVRWSPRYQDGVGLSVEQAYGKGGGGGGGAAGGDGGGGSA